MTLADMDWRAHAAALFAPRPRKWPTPGALARALDPSVRDSEPLRIIDRELARLADHQVPADGLMIFCPAQEGKSERISRRFPAWLLDHNPALRIAIVSYEKDIAVRWGRQILRDLHSQPGLLRFDVMADSSAAGRWDTTAGGGIYSIGIGGALAGRPADVLKALIIDDPVKGRAEAESEVYRNAAWDWWENVAIERLAPGGIVVLMMTRWHQDDLAGRILSRPSPLRWRVLSMPAISEGPGDALGRPAGVEFPSVRNRPPGYFARLRAALTPYVFQSVYQQTPAGPAGNFFRRPAFRYWKVPAGCPAPERVLARPGAVGAWIECEGRKVDLADPGVWRFATVDVAASEKTTADWTVVSVWAITRDGDLILLARQRGRVEMADHFSMARPLRQAWAYDLLYVEKQFYSKTLVTDARRAGVPVAEVTADKDKVTRAIPAAGRVHAGKVWFPAVTSGCTCGACDGRWGDEWADELCAFPRAAHDDQVDTLSYAARIQAAHWTPPAPPARTRPPAAGMEAITSAYAAATGNGTHEVDLLNAPLG